MKIQIKPYGLFEIIKVTTPGLHNCKQCWFGKHIAHCPEQIKCVCSDKTCIIFDKIGK